MEQIRACEVAEAEAAPIEAEIQDEYRTKLY
jgi:hypothetical protein